MVKNSPLRKAQKVGAADLGMMRGAILRALAGLEDQSVGEVIRTVSLAVRALRDLEEWEADTIVAADSIGSERERSELLARLLLLAAADAPAESAGRPHPG